MRQLQRFVPAIARWEHLPVGRIQIAIRSLKCRLGFHVWKTERTPLSEASTDLVIKMRGPVEALIVGAGVILAHYLSPDAFIRTSCIHCGRVDRERYF